MYEWIEKNKYGLMTVLAVVFVLLLDHCFAHVAGFYTLMSYGSSFATVPGNSLRNIPSTIKAIRPTIMLSVPSLAKSFKKTIEAGVKAKGPMMEKLYNMALKNAIIYNKEGYNKGTKGSFWSKPLYLPMYMPVTSTTIS